MYPALPLDCKPFGERVLFPVLHNAAERTGRGNEAHSDDPPSVSFPCTWIALRGALTAMIRLDHLLQLPSIVNHRVLPRGDFSLQFMMSVSSHRVNRWQHSPFKILVATLPPSSLEVMEPLAQCLKE